MCKILFIAVSLSTSLIKSLKTKITSFLHHFSFDDSCFIHRIENEILFNIQNTIAHEVLILSIFLCCTDLCEHVNLPLVDNITLLCSICQNSMTPCSLRQADKVFPSTRLFDNNKDASLPAPTFMDKTQNLPLKIVWKLWRMGVGDMLWPSEQMPVNMKVMAKNLWVKSCTSVWQMFSLSEHNVWKVFTLFSGFILEFDVQHKQYYRYLFVTHFVKLGYRKKINMTWLKDFLQSCMPIHIMHMSVLCLLLLLQFIYLLLMLLLILIERYFLNHHNIPDLLLFWRAVLEKYKEELMAIGSLARNEWY